MAVTKLILFASALLVTTLFIGVNSSRSNETWHEHAVEKPEEVAAMVDIHFYFLQRMYKCLVINYPVTKREYTGQSKWKHWNWRSEGDLFLNGAFFTRSGAGAGAGYARASSLSAKSSSLVGTMTSYSGALNCRAGRRC
ncbi:unnamed protein product [Brassica rapa]|uniref:Uncharacterized protein n=1 Tax=Brassica campestris TaxID=3711 RepID=A0A8D9GEJ7_BRACM|nr:unnamed protein product [Brassica rapa]